MCIRDRLKPIHPGHETIKYERNPPQQIPLPMNARRMHREVEQKLIDIAAWAETCGLNRIEPGSSKLGIVASGIAYQYAREVFPDATFLKLGLVYPLPRDLFFKLEGMVERMVVVEELDPIFEHHIRLLGIKASGKDIFPLCGEFSTELVRERAVAAGLIQAEEIAVRSAAPVVINGLDAVAGDGSVPEPSPATASRPLITTGAAERTAISSAWIKPAATARSRTSSVLNSPQSGKMSLPDALIPSSLMWCSKIGSSSSTTTIRSTMPSSLKKRSRGSGWTRPNFKKVASGNTSRAY